MNLLAIAAFGFLFLRADRTVSWLVVPEGDVAFSLAIALGQIPLLMVAGALVSGRTRRLLARDRESSDPVERAQVFHHRATSFLRVAILIGFGASVFLTRWPDLFQFGAITPELQILGDFITLSPFVMGLVVLWWITFPAELALRDEEGLLDGQDKDEKPKGLSFGAYLDFNIRHHLLVAAVPITLILFASNLTRGYEEPLQSLFGRKWAPDILLGVVAFGVFVIAPVILRRVWRTTPLEPGPVRDQLEALCAKVGLRCREILVWHSDDMIINAAVMGLFPSVRYVLLSDGLLATMNARQIQAVFGHAAGHIRHRHLQHFLVFALVGWLVVAGLMECLARFFYEPGGSGGLSLFSIQVIGVVATVVFWGVGFGWISRRFERQADLFGARCVAPDAAECAVPCSVHVDGATSTSSDGRVCATGATVFTSALDRVAVLNGIPHEERSWRHSSIGSRVRFLNSLAGDPARTVRFERLLRRVTRGLMAIALIGCACAAAYYVEFGEPILLRANATGK